MGNKKPSLFSQIRPYLKGFQLPLALAFVGAVLSNIITVYGPNKLKEILAFHMTERIHGTEEAKKAEEASEALFGNGANNANMPTIEIEAETSILDAIILAGFAQSKGQAKTLIAQGGITLNDNKVEDLQLKITSNMLSEELILKKGKKGFCKLISK